MKYKKFSDNKKFQYHNNRSAELGEVFSPRELVDLMNKISGIKNAHFLATVFEPGCGTGNFVSEILFLKLKKLQSLKNKVNDEEFLINYYLTIASLYFNDIDKQNIEYTSNRLFDICFKFLLKNRLNENIILDNTRTIINDNAILGDLINELDYLKFVQYDREGNNIIRTLFKLSDMKDKEDKQLSLFEEEQKRSDIFLINDKNKQLRDLN